ncbi:hypothetical protein N7G274_000104 [Stereocaulon virgatum]|uniref:NACHT-NTPase and P-loop NTPases N-terminal domain-containing protein n=1 Tax=Stereocaulon virgatum TaxID=373712 RepID=A0ABR4AR75_9LECA
MTGIGEAGLVLGLISSIITIIDTTTQVYSAVEDEAGLPKDFKKAAAKLPLISKLLEDAETYVSKSADKTIEAAFRPIIEDCKTQATALQQLFEKVIPKGDSRWDRYVKAARTIGKGGRVETLIQRVLDDLQLMTSKFPEATTSRRKEKLVEAIEEVSKMEPSLPDDFDQMPTYAYYGSGPQNINASNGTQNDNTGAGHQNTGTGSQYIGSNYIDTRNQLSHLAFAEKAPFNSIDRQYEPTCHPDTRVDLVASSYEGGGDVSRARKFVTTIAVQLADNVPSLKPHICRTIADRSNIASLSLQDQWRQLILSPLSKLEGNLYQPYTLVIDALDECENGNEVQIILTLLLEAASLETHRLQILLTSRPEIAIQRGLSQTPEAKYCNFILHNISPPLVDHDIEVFLRDKLEKIGKESWLDSWPEDKAIKNMVRRASGLFVWAATACRFISEGEVYAPRRLDTILEGSSSAVTAPEKHLDEIYITVLKLLGFPKGKIDQSLKGLHAILVVPEDQTHPLRLHHPSFRDFLLSAQRCCDPYLQVEQKNAHKILTNHCIQLMSQKLRKKNLYGLRDPGPIGSQIPFEELARCLPPELQYACEYWVSHLQRSEVKVNNKQYLDDGGPIHIFMQQYFLYWLEALSLAGKLSEGIHAIRTLEDIVDASKSPRLYNFIYDAKRFVLYNRSNIERAPLQLYCSALVFAPENSIIRKQFEEYIPPWILRKPKVQADWSNALQILEGHSDNVSSVAFSPDGKQVVSGSDDGTVRLWDSVTGAALQTLEGHSDNVSSVAFSPGGRVEPALSRVRNWVVEGEISLLWLPPGYRETRMTVWNKVIALGHEPGRVSILGFKEGPKYI